MPGDSFCLFTQQVGLGEHPVPAAGLSHQGSDGSPADLVAVFSQEAYIPGQGTENGHGPTHGAAGVGDAGQMRAEMTIVSDDADDEGNDTRHL